MAVRGSIWDGIHPNNLTEDTFALVVDSVREIINAVQPVRTFYTLEPMPWTYPNEPENYLRLLTAVNRPQFGAHPDPVNGSNSPDRHFLNVDFLRECFAALAPRLMVHLNEVRPGLGSLGYYTLLREIAYLDPESHLLLEHLPSEGGDTQVAKYVRSVAAEIGIDFLRKLRRLCRASL